MNEKLSLYNIAQLLTVKTGVETANIEKFIIELITIINEGIRKDGIVKIKGFGTFKIILVKERESVHINTGERIVIPPHHKLSFKPEEELKELINQPFSIFETIEATDENLKKNSDLSMFETNEDVNEEEPASSQALISDYKIVDDEPEQIHSENDNEEADIIPPAGIPDVNQEDDLSVNEDKEITPPLPEDKPATTDVTTSDSENNETSVATDNSQKEEVITPPVPPVASQPPVKSKGNSDKKKKSKSSSLMPLYLILALLIFVLAGCVWYYFAYSRSFDSFNKDYSTKVSNDSFVLPGDSVSEKQALEKANILSKDTIRSTANTEVKSSGSDVPSESSSANKEVTTSKPAKRTETSPPSKPAAATTKKPSSTETNNTKPASTSNSGKVLAKIKMESGNRLTLVAEKYYGNKLFWVYIYDFNKDKIGSNPDNIRAGMEILVPTKETYGIDANNASSVEKARKLQSQLMAGKK